MQDQAEVERLGWKGRILKLLIFLLLAIFILPLGIIYLINSLYLRIRFWFVAIRTGKFILFITSDSPNWSDYIQHKIMPVIEPYAVVLNWSERNKWQPSLGVQLFHHWGGKANFNPMAIVFVNIFKVQTIRFRDAFFQLKHGNEAALGEAQQRLFDLLDRKRTK